MRRQNGPRARPLAEVHGLRSTYTNRRCRCERCTKANRAYKREWRRRR